MHIIKDQSKAVIAIAIISAMIHLTYGAIDSHKKVDINAEETHLYINENGAPVDEKIIRDKTNEMLILDVPAHHDRMETKVILDEKSVSTRLCNIVVISIIS